MCVIWTFLLPTAKRKKVERIKCQRGTIANETVAMTTLGVILKEEPPRLENKEKGEECYTCIPHAYSSSLILFDV